MRTAILYLFFTITVVGVSCQAQIENAATTSVRVYGNCGMCKKRIEKAANVSGVAQVKWNSDTEMAEITYNKQKTNPDEILRKIAAAGHDSDKYRADKKVYDALHECCKYDRPD